MTQWLIVMLLVVISGCSTSNGGLNPDLTHSNEIVSAVGYASISEQSGRTQEEKSLRAMRASKLDAYRELSEQIYGLRISATTSLSNQQLGPENTDGAVDGIIRGAKVIRSYPVGDSYVTEMELNLGLMERMKQHGEVFHVPNNQQVMF
ncbi:flagellar biosynthesis protein FlgP [Photobacterium kishitanii]|uniref:Flagellar biosynthesis protein FlgP n=1 Tax=Photobacterium kishitanii TaxID=318456 RepID=A0A0B7JF84_9GAMM|nr:LPP20 family lipoprotein [Photobacterium kishitanii]OBU22863.1 flagellar biosynthesis protein FlgP [Photobacterium kishitanii]PSU97399.1 flagellar biosynthesis protein FlgP [Photobacterium kishitanii]PSV01491.1 flagellar biosynthesis protein FlgP [Photobacterium kishitanii]PSV21494.1 flagellar biosynthesis protein FlgP [Photobacterium kishitanii]PSW68742.1 flagellar biosynthesis protein FlgP [Photobacterium kishitanii]